MEEVIVSDEVVEEVVVEQEQPVVVEKQNDQVPLSTLLEEKKKRKELEKRLRQLEEKDLDSEIISEKNKIKQKYIDKGYDEVLAESLADDFSSIKGEIKKTSKKDYLDDDIQDLARDTYYSDALVYQKEIKLKVKEFKTKGIDLDVEDAYNLVRNPKLKSKEQREDFEQKEILKKREESKTSGSLNATASTPTNPYPLDAEDKKALLELQKMMPQGGWNTEKYYKLMKK